MYKPSGAEIDFIMMAAKLLLGSCGFIGATVIPQFPQNAAPGAMAK
jgi:hypothetical protein